MSKARMDSQVLEQTLPDGNCSFNAFVLGWSRPEVLSYMDHLQPPKKYPSSLFAEFIKQSAQVLGSALSWRSVKSRLLFLRQYDKAQLQKQMSPVFRHLSVNLAGHNQVFRERTEEHLKSAFYDFISPVHRSVSDDIFSRHQFIIDKFREYSPVKSRWLSLNWFKSAPQVSEEAIIEANKKLVTWWLASKGGYELFLQAMAQHGEWAGDIELNLLADFFDINLDIKRQNFVHHIHFNHGVVKRELFDEDQVIQLVCRGIVNHVKTDDTELQLLPLAEQEVNERLSAVPNCEVLRDFIWLNQSLAGKVVPESSVSALKQLILRDIVIRQNDDYLFSCDQNKAVNLLEEFPEKEKMLSAWRQYYIATKPTITLVNENATHWDHLQTIPVQQFDPHAVITFKIATLLAAQQLYLALLIYTGKLAVSQKNNHLFGFFNHTPVTIAADTQPSQYLSL